jgi:hypothetical protein
MALFKYDKKEYKEKQLTWHTLRTKKMTNKLGVLFRSYAGDVRASYRSFGLPVFPGEFNESLRLLLAREYTRTADLFSEFHRDYLTLTPERLAEVEVVIEDSLRSSLFAMSETQSSFITTTTQRNLMRAVEQVREVSGDLTIGQEANLIHQELTTNVAPRARLISTTETTRVSELSKRTEVEQLVSHLTTDEINTAYGDELSEEELDSIEGMGAAAAVSAGLLLVSRTWNAVLDSSTRIGHAAATGQTISNPRDTFDVGGEALSFPGDPIGSAANTINCRCFLTYST